MNIIYEIINKPCLTEKAVGLQEHNNQVVFKVVPRANKIEIKEAVEDIFKVKVYKVRTANMVGKSRRVGRSLGRTQDWKKAVITLVDGQKIDFLE